MPWFFASITWWHRIHHGFTIPLSPNISGNPSKWIQILTYILYKLVCLLGFCKGKPLPPKIAKLLVTLWCCPAPHPIPVPSSSKIPLPQPALMRQGALELCPWILWHTWPPRKKFKEGWIFSKLGDIWIDIWIDDGCSKCREGKKDWMYINHITS